MLLWQKATFSGGGEGNECVELARTGNTTLLRESDDPNRIVALSGHTLAALLAKIQSS
ncbi:DUF397 domain-containing protein [Streptomyces sp. NPDC046465]|uniref:DUF397 domain-containing protein n=1 Tax=Streptomyces sp. NPDC046465 TaxID=3155810 RepID=UPI0033E4B11D